ncbi:3-methyladenine DNA glycosylase [Promicromonospora panici]|uniref:3-methyladenine DNA glycosylase n=1 Tax=Promicromonospora panici TaxID=2219658 RepID=UPI001F5DB676|nr:3-methyladenine DNA glycosylase [Promicromonospora panici]
MSTILGEPIAPAAPDAVGPGSGAQPARVLLPEEWLPLATAHAERADALTAVWREARAAGRKHAIEDFLFTYYPTRITHLRRWHPGGGVALQLPDDDGTGTPEPGSPGYGAAAPGAADPEDRTTWRWHTTVPHDAAVPGPTCGPSLTVTLDPDAFLADRGDTVRYVRELLSATASRPGTFGCFGLHEWAMVYRDREAGRDQRHPLPLRLGHAGTDAVVEANPVRCSHFDAYRFFTPEATGRNQLRPTRATQVGLEQPGCLHANMDLYKWCLKLGPAVPGDLLLDAFELARDIRWTDMAASPYDVSEYGVAAVEIETPHGKAEYVRRQREYARRSKDLRRRLIEVCDVLLGAGSTG